tara:strand:+ start:54 stop:1145 length:1092 start_codon:yes stop_codon:yes gene_type:complete
MAYTTIDDPSAFFQTTTYTGGGAGTVVTNGGNSDLKPDWLWIKNRTDGYAHFVVDSSRNISYAQNSSNAPYLETNSNPAENNNQNWMQSVNTDGFTTGIAEHINNNAGSAFVAWQWKCNNGTRTTFSESGDNPGGGYQANTTAGFSIVDYTGTGATGTLAHGLSAVPKLIIVKDRDATRSWSVYHHQMGSPAIEKNMHLNTTAAVTDYNAEYWSGTNPTTSVFGLGNADDVNKDGEKFIAYVFAEKQGYSKFGKYVGNGNSDGPFVYTGFRPAFVLLKRTNGTGGWTTYDSKRGHNGNNYELFPNSSEAEYTGTSYFEADILSNGFKLRLTNSQINGSGDSYIYMAFAEHPFTTSTGIPTTAR